MFHIRPFHLLALVLLGLSACMLAIPRSASANPTPGFRLGEPVATEAEALRASRLALLSQFAYEEPLEVVSIDQVTYGAYRSRFGAGGDYPASLPVWLVIYFDGAWRVPAPSVPPFSGCMRVVIQASDGSLLHLAGPLRNGVLPECDR